MKEIFISTDAVGHHDARISIIGCMDFRLQEARRDYIQSRYGEKYFDQIIVPGSCKHLIEEGDVQTILGVDVSCDLHHVERIVIFHHTDCGAYGGHAAFDDPVVERAYQEEQVRRAREIVIAHFTEIDHAVPVIDLVVEVIDEERGGVTYLAVA